MISTGLDFTPIDCLKHFLCCVTESLSNFPIGLLQFFLQFRIGFNFSPQIIFWNKLNQISFSFDLNQGPFVFSDPPAEHQSLLTVESLQHCVTPPFITIIHEMVRHEPAGLINVLPPVRAIYNRKSTQT